MSSQSTANVQTQNQQSPSSDIEWWRGAVIYQIYPRSFQDTNGDGVGDLQGIIQRLNYIASLGVDAIWISPFFKSPMDDFGYDVEDYYAVDPLFGSLEDFDALIKKAHSLNLKLIIDQVYSHTSDQHAWFKESRKSKDNPKSDWYVWADPKPDGTPPTNWQSVFGGGAWEWDNTRRQYYLHNFLTSQPDLNLHNPEVQAALLDVATFWLDRGVDGFRLDALNFCMHDQELRDNPPVRFFDKEPTRPFDFQQHVNNMSQPEVVDFLEKIRSLTNSYSPPRFTVAEIGGSDPLKDMQAYTAQDERLNTAYSFAYLSAEQVSSKLVKNTSNDWPNSPDTGWPSWAFSNHDAPRVVSRWSNKEDQVTTAKLYVLLLLNLRGNIFLYQGEELGLPQAHVPFEKLQDPEAIANWPETLGRDGARTPMPWSKGAIYAGFSQAEPWLPIDKSHFGLSADEQEDDTTSTLNFVKRLIAFRQTQKALQLGEINFLESSSEQLLIFTRVYNEEVTLCVINLSDQAVPLSGVNPPDWTVAISTENTLENSTLPEYISAHCGFICCNA